jgi:hypothetical protein
MKKFFGLLAVLSVLSLGCEPAADTTDTTTPAPSTTTTPDTTDDTGTTTDSATDADTDTDVVE